MRRLCLLLLVCLAVAAPASAQIAFDASSPDLTGGGSFTHTVTGSNTVLVVGCFDDTGAANLMTAVAWNPPGGAQPLTKIAERKAPSDRWASLWYVLAPTAGTYSITITTTAGFHQCSAESLTGVGALDTFGTSTTASGSSVATTITVAANAWIVSFVRQDATPAVTWTNATQRENPSGSAIFLADSNAAKTGSTTTTATIGGTQNFAMISASFTPSGGGGGGGGGTGALMLMGVGK